MQNPNSCCKMNIFQIPKFFIVFKENNCLQEACIIAWGYYNQYVCNAPAVEIFYLVQISPNLCKWAVLVTSWKMFFNSLIFPKFGKIDYLFCDRWYTELHNFNI